MLISASVGCTLTYLILAETGEPLDASIDLASDSVILHSRGGGGRNPDYGRALRLILQRLRSSQMPIVRVFVDSERVQNMTIEERIVLNGNELRSQEADPFTLISVRAAAVGQTLGTKGGNPTKKLRFQFSEGFSSKAMLATF